MKHAKKNRIKMKIGFSKLHALGITALSLVLLAICFNNCSMGDAYQSQSGVSSSGVLSLNPSTVNLTAGQQTTFQATGGSGSYTYYMYGGNGTFSATGVYVAPVAQETDTLQVVDSQGNQAFATVVVGTTSSIATGSGTLAISPSTLTVISSSNTSFSASGGVGNYIFTMYGGSGTITTAGYYTAPSTAETDYIQVTDSSGGTAYATITVQSSSAVASTEIYSYSSTKPDHVYSTVSSGVSGYTFVKNAFKVFSAAGNSGTVALYSCHRSSNGVHFLSIDSTCAGQVNDATIGYIYSAPTSGFSALYAYGSASGLDTIDTVTPTDGTSISYLYEGIIGYVGSP